MTDEERAERFRALLAKYLGVDTQQLDGEFCIDSDEDPEYAEVTWAGYCHVPMDELTRLAGEAYEDEGT